MLIIDAQAGQPMGRTRITLRCVERALPPVDVTAEREGKCWALRAQHTRGEQRVGPVTTEDHVADGVGPFVVPATIGQISVPVTGLPLRYFESIVAKVTDRGSDPRRQAAGLTWLRKFVGPSTDTSL